METGKESRVKESEAQHNKVDSFALFPDDLLLDVLRKLPRDILRHNTRFVCKRWFRLTTNSVLLDHTAFAVRGAMGYRYRLINASKEKQGLKTKTRYLEIPGGGYIESWCNEFLLMRRYKDRESLYVYDLISNQGSIIPPCSTTCGFEAVGLSYDKFKRVYKVVNVFMGPECFQCELLTLKSDTASYNSLNWKKINIPRYVVEKGCYLFGLVSVQARYFHWDLLCDKYLVSLDTVKERFRLTPLPGSNTVALYEPHFVVEMGGFLTLFSEVSQDKIDIWMLKDYQRSKWENLMSITVSSDVWSSIRIESYAPSSAIRVISMRYVIFMRKGSEYGLYSYDLKTKMIKRLEVDLEIGEGCMFQTTSCMPSE